MAMWIESQNDRLQELGTELDTVRRETASKMDVDRLTGLLNQAALAKRTETIAGFSGVVAVCDMDNFKSINDRFGHQTGDEVLRRRLRGRSVDVRAFGGSSVGRPLVWLVRQGAMAGWPVRWIAR